MKYIVGNEKFVCSSCFVASGTFSRALTKSPEVTDVVLDTQIVTLDEDTVGDTDSQAFHCDSCDNNFTSATDLSDHIDSIHEQPEYKCDFCEYKSTSISKNISFRRFRTVISESNKVFLTANSQMVAHFI